MTKKIKFTNLLVMVFMAFPAFSGENTLEPGDEIPFFTATTDAGTVWESSDYAGDKNLVVYFYPAAMTGGCTKQACAYRDAQSDFSLLNAEVVGVSGDAVENLKLFKQAHNLNFTLLSDPDAGIANKFGVPVSLGEKSIEREIEGMMHTLSRSATTSRWTFVFNKEGKLVYKSTQVNAAEDSRKVLEVLKGL